MTTETSTLTPAEKASVTASYASILQSKETLDAQATEHDIVMEKIACDDAIDALSAYLTGNPGWAPDATEDMVIVPAEYTAAFDAVFTTMRELQTAIAAAIAAAQPATPDPVV